MSEGPTTHVVGAGLAGLAAAVRLALQGRRVVLYEAAPQAGGRCRSYEDKQLGVTLDNGNHLLLSGNREALSYLAAIGAADSLIGPAATRFPFLDLASGERWTVEPSAGRLPWWLLSGQRRIPGSSLGDWLEARHLALAGAEATVAQAIRRRGALWRRFWQPLTVAALNTRPEEGSARLLWEVLRRSFLRGAAACRPLIARDSLAASFVAPALATLARLGAEVRFGWRLRALERGETRIGALLFDAARLDLDPADRVILAVTPWVAAELLPELNLAFEPRPIVNAHMVLPAASRLPAELPLLGLVGGTAEWLFARGRVVSLTVSAAEALADTANETLSRRLWADTAAALNLPPEPRPPLRILREKRATFAATPAAAARRPGAATGWANLALAGDYTATDLPSTIEGAIQSGHSAAAVVGR
jgi:squalene-associated FAD-dependent desaturase